MTTRLYYDDSDLFAFDATVLSCVPAGDRFEVTLDRTAFYPTSGGQPFDTGTLGCAQVVDVLDRDDGRIVHVVAAPLAPGERVRGAIDAVRRQDHREQHTGQHVLSAAFERTCGAATVGFHMGADASTIDLAREVSAAEMTAAETDANLVVRENRAVTVRTVAAEDVGTIGLRRESKRTGPLRIVEVDDFDVSACGGTHVTRTGAIGLIAIAGVEKVRGGSRLTFLCGERALRGFRERQSRLADLGRLLGVAPLDVVPHVERLREEVRAGQRVMKDLQADLARYRAVEWRGQAETIGPLRVVIRATAFDAGTLKSLAQAIVEAPGIVAVLSGAGDPLPLVVARSAGVEFDAGAFVKTVVAASGGRGGGRPELAQGGVMASAADVELFVRRTLAAEQTGQEERGRS